MVVATNTLEDGHYDHSYLDGVMTNLQKMGTQSKTKHIIIQSTTIPGYCDSVFQRLEKYNYTISYNPEFIRQGTILKDQENPDMILIGTGSEEVSKRLSDIFNRMCVVPPPYGVDEPNIRIMDNLSAEITKLALNCFLTTKISFTNMIGDLAVQVGASPDKILGAISSDSRVGNKLMKYGYGYGGTCLPRDNRALAVFAKDNDMPIDISYATDKINKSHLNFQIKQFVECNDKNKPVVLNGVSFKNGSDIIEESQQLAFAVGLATEGFDVTIRDNIFVLEQVKKIYNNLFKYEEINV